MLFRLPALLVATIVAAAPSAANAQGDLLPPLRFLGIEVGLPLVDLGREVTTLGGKSLRCDRSRRDPSVRDCRASVRSPGSGQPLALWASVIDSATGILTLSGPVTGVQLDEWRTRLEEDYGTVGAQVQGSQWMMQWVREGRMIRLTWRIENGTKVASVSLVDGRVLDAWGRRRTRGSMSPPAARTPAGTTASPGRAGQR
ncbi:MAG: hypothetical protein ABI742_02660 [Gemmatimonadota bacterium]